MRKSRFLENAQFVLMSISGLGFICYLIMRTKVGVMSGLVDTHLLVFAISTIIYMASVCLEEKKDKLLEPERLCDERSECLVRMTKVLRRVNLVVVCIAFILIVICFLARTSRDDLPVTVSIEEVSGKVNGHVAPPID